MGELPETEVDADTGFTHLPPPLCGGDLGLQMTGVGSLSGQFPEPQLPSLKWADNTEAMGFLGEIDLLVGGVPPGAAVGPLWARGSLHLPRLCLLPQAHRQHCPGLSVLLGYRATC